MEMQAPRRKRLQTRITVAAGAVAVVAIGVLLWHYGHAFLDYVKATLDGIPEWVRLLLAALATLSEAVPILGLIVPSNTLVFLLSWHSGATGGTPWALVAAHTVGSLAGDVLVYALGARYGIAFMEKWPGIFRLTAERRLAMERLVHAHAVKTVILARFQPGTRSFAPYVAGAVRLPFGKYMVASLVASLGLAVVVVIGGWLTGIGLETLGKALGWAATGVVVGIVALAALYWWLTRKLRIMTGTTMTLALVGALGTGLAGGLLLDAATGDAIQEAEMGIHAPSSPFAASAWSWPQVLALLGPLAPSAGVVATVLGWPTLLAGFLAWSAWALARRRAREAAIALAAGPGLLLAVAGLRSALPRAPPAGTGPWPLAPGFPEVTAALAAALAGLLLWELLPAAWSRVQRRIFTYDAWALALAVAAAPLLAGWSWPTETVAGLALGAGWVSWCLLVDTWLTFRDLRRRQAPAPAPRPDAEQP
jgi:membrane protein DedA with SNARE-associated domain